MRLGLSPSTSGGLGPRCRDEAAEEGSENGSCKPTRVIYFCQLLSKLDLPLMIAERLRPEKGREGTLLVDEQIYVMVWLWVKYT